MRNSPHLCKRVDPSQPGHDPVWISIVKDQAGWRIERPANPDRSRVLVVAQHKEDLGWLSEVDCSVVVYSKGKAYGIESIPQPNLGRESSAYLAYIVDNYNDLPELVMFSQGNPFPHSPDFVARTRHRYEQPTSLSCRYLAEYPGPDVTSQDLVEHVHGHEVRYGLATAYGQFDYRTDLPTWSSRAWSTVFAGPAPSPFHFGYGCLWAVPRASILARPRELWEFLLGELLGPGGSLVTDKDPRFILNAWTMEVLWRYLFASPEDFPTKTDLGHASLPVDTASGSTAIVSTIEPRDIASGHLESKYFTWTCGCGRELKADPRKAGHLMRCPGCHGTFQVPGQKPLVPCGKCKRTPSG